MTNISCDLLFNILNYNHNINILINKDYYSLLKSIKKSFKTKPLEIEYSLVKCRQKMGNSDGSQLYRRSPSIKVMPVKKYHLDGNIPLGDIKDGKITSSVDVKSILLPKSERFVYPYYLWNYYPNSYILIYWEIFNITTPNLERAIVYSQLIL